jgi:phosphoribosylformylglycinamidine synthase
MIFDVKIIISLKSGMLDPEACAIQHALSNLGFETEYLNNSKLYSVGIKADDAESARVRAEEMCERLLANPVIQSYSVEVTE